MTNHPSLPGPIDFMLFDCDGVLVNSEEIALQSELALIAAAGLAYSAAEYQELFSGLTKEDFDTRLIADYARRTGRVLPLAFFTQLEDNYRRIEASQLRAPEGLAMFLGQLKGKGVGIGVVSNGEMDGILRKLEIVGVRDFFGKNIFSKDMVARPKPAPDVYLYAMAQMGCTDAGRVCVLEDSLTGARAAIDAGTQVIGFVHGAHRPADHAGRLEATGVTATAHSIQDVAALLAA